MARRYDTCDFYTIVKLSLQKYENSKKDLNAIRQLRLEVFFDEENVNYILRNYKNNTVCGDTARGERYGKVEDYVRSQHQYALKEFEGKVPSKPVTTPTKNSQADIEFELKSAANLFDDDFEPFEKSQTNNNSQVDEVLSKAYKKNVKRPEIEQVDDVAIEDLSEHDENDTLTIFNIEDIKNFKAENFVKGSKEMARISAIVKKFLDEETDKYIQAGFTEQEVTAELNELETKFKAICDEKREELNRGLIAKKLKMQNAERVKYHHMLRKNEEIEDDGLTF